jgi:ABC-type amino acid transport substrate-binding protein
MKVATLVGTTSGLFLKENDIKHYTYDDITSGLVDIEKGELDAFVYDLPILQYLIKEGGLEGSVAISEKTFDVQYYGFGISKSNPKFKNDVDRYILKYINDGDWDNILFKYNLRNDE